LTATLTPPKGQSTIRKVDRKISISTVLDNPNLPSPPALALQIVEKASQPGCDPGEVVALLSKDSALCLQVLKTVNSGMFGLKKSVGSLKQAVMMLGVRPLRSLVLSLALPAIRIPDKDEVVMKYWQESVAGAVIARELAVTLKRKDPDDDLVAGLLRDLGVLVLREAFPDEYRNLWKNNAKTWAANQCELEAEMFGVHHAEISAAILESWHLPPEIHAPIRNHHNPSSFVNESQTLQQRAWILCFASKVATLHSSSTTTVSELLQFAESRFSMNQAALIKFLGSVTPAVLEFASLLKVDIGQCPNYSAVIATGCQELVRLSLETAREAVPATDVYHKNPAPTDVDKTAAFPHSMGTSTRPATHQTLPEFDMDCLRELPSLGAWLNGYEIKSMLGRGAMGVVFKAFDPSLNRFAAIKMMTPERVILSEARDWFLREARAAAAIQHENIVTIYAVSELNGLPYLVMEHLAGTSLQDRLDKEGPLPMADIIRYGKQIAHGLGAAHERRVIHRDIKPANILLAREGVSAKITDFGLARVLDEGLRSPEGFWVGTPQYMAPEQFGNADVDHRADLFSLGSMLYTLCTGKTPFPAETIPLIMQQIRNNAPIAVTKARPETPAWLANVINKLHAKLPAGRYQSADEVAKVFEQNG